MENKLEQNIIKIIKGLNALESIYKSATLENSSFKLVQHLKNEEYPEVKYVLENALASYDAADMLGIMRPAHYKEKTQQIKDVISSIKKDINSLKKVDVKNLPEVKEYIPSKKETEKIKQNSLKRNEVDKKWIEEIKRRPQYEESKEEWELPPKEKEEKPIPKKKTVKTPKRVNKAKSEEEIKQRPDPKEVSVEKPKKEEEEVPPRKVLKVDARTKRKEGEAPREFPKKQDLITKFTKVKKPESQKIEKIDPEVTKEELRKRKEQKNIRKFEEKCPEFSALLKKMDINGFEDFERKILGSEEPIGLDKSLKNNMLTQMVGKYTTEIKNYAKENGHDIGGYFEISSAITTSLRRANDDLGIRR